MRQFAVAAVSATILALAVALPDADAMDRATAYGVQWAQLSNMRAYAAGNPFRITRIGCATRKLRHVARVFPVYVCDAVIRDKRDAPPVVPGSLSTAQARSFGVASARPHGPSSLRDLAACSRGFQAPVFGAVK